MSKKAHLFNTIIGAEGLIANGSLGLPGQVLVSNGSGIFWGFGGYGGSGTGGTTNIVGGDTMGFFLTFPPRSSEIVGMYTVTRKIKFLANLQGSDVHVGIYPNSTYVFNVNYIPLGGVSTNIGHITVYPGGGIVLDTVGGLEYTLNEGDTIVVMTQPQIDVINMISISLRFASVVLNPSELAAYQLYTTGYTGSIGYTGSGA